MSDELPEEGGAKKTQFKVGNDAWKARSSHGRNPIFSSPDELWGACCEYFQWVNDNPLYSVELVKFQGEATQAQVPKMRAMTIAGLCNFLDIGLTTWSDYREKPDFPWVNARVESIIYQQKIEGASADMLNANIISRELGLTEKKEIDNKGGGLTINRVRFSDANS